jgi:N-acetylglutamate synthase-like GNAT family acetyltransferase
MKTNSIKYSLSEFKDLVSLSRKHDNSLNWSGVLDLSERPPVVSIHIVDDSDSSNVLAYAVWGWSNQDMEMKFGKIEVKKTNRERGYGTIIMKMIIAIAKYYQSQRITGTVTGKEFLWDWYSKLGFIIFDGNKLLMELSKNENKE